MNPSAFMRGQLASIGIFLNEPEVPVVAPAPQRMAVLEVDRELVRQILVEAGAPARDVDWMVESCPSVEHALSYRPTVWNAWCPICDGVVDADARGCLTCQRIKETL